MFFGVFFGPSFKLNMADVWREHLARQSLNLGARTYLNWKKKCFYFLGLLLICAESRTAHEPFASVAELIRNYFHFLPDERLYCFIGQIPCQYILLVLCSFVSVANKHRLLVTQPLTSYFKDTVFWNESFKMCKQLTSGLVYWFWIWRGEAD